MLIKTVLNHISIFKYIHYHKEFLINEAVWYIKSNLVILDDFKIKRQVSDLWPLYSPQIGSSTSKYLFSDLCTVHKILLTFILSANFQILWRASPVLYYFKEILRFCGDVVRFLGSCTCRGSLESAESYFIIAK